MILKLISIIYSDFKSQEKNPGFFLPLSHILKSATATRLQNSAFAQKPPSESSFNNAYTQDLQLIARNRRVKSLNKERLHESPKIFLFLDSRLHYIWYWYWYWY